MREYFYTIDREGNLFHDGTLLTDAKFLNFFFKRVKPNDTGQHSDYRYVSPCGKEMNYIAAEDTPIVFQKHEDHRLFYAPGLSVELEPESLIVRPNEVLYHPAPAGEFGRIGTKVILSWYNYLDFRNDAGATAPSSQGEVVIQLPGYNPAVIRRLG